MPGARASGRLSRFGPAAPQVRVGPGAVAPRASGTLGPHTLPWFPDSVVPQIGVAGEPPVALRARRLAPRLMGRDLVGSDPASSPAE